MRIAHLNPVGVVGGAERVLLAAVRQTRTLRPDWPVSVVLLGDGPLAGRLESLGATVQVVPLPATLAGMGDSQLRGGGTPAALARLGGAAVRGVPAGADFLRHLRQTLRRLRPDILHSHGLKTHLLAAVGRPRGVPVAWHLHDFYSHRPLVGKLLHRLRRGVAVGVAISDAVRRDAESVLPGLPVRTVLNAVDLGHFTPGPADGAALDRLAGLSPPVAGTVRVGLVGTYANWKGHTTFVEALAGCRGVRGYVVGGPIYATAGSQVTRDELEALAGRLRLTVGFVPFRADPADVYRALDVVVHASTRPEPFGLTVAEAMACGRAVVVAAAGGAAELFADGVDAVGHTPGDVRSLAGAMARLARDASFRERLGTAARATAERRFDEGRFGRELMVCYEAMGRG